MAPSDSLNPEAIRPRVPGLNLPFGQCVEIERKPSWLTYSASCRPWWAALNVRFGHVVAVPPGSVPAFSADCSLPPFFSFNAIRAWTESPLRVASQRSNQLGQRVRETWQSVGSEWTINALSFTQCNVLATQLVFDLDWEPTHESRASALTNSAKGSDLQVFCWEHFKCHSG